MGIALDVCDQSSGLSRTDDFLSLLSPISRYACRAFRFLNPEARDEAVQEVVAKAFVAYRGLIERGRMEAVAPAPLARFAIAQTKAGRCVGGRLNSDDVSSRHCQLRRGIGLRSLERIDDATGSWKEILIEDPSATPAEVAAIRLDFQCWLGTLPRRQRQIAELLSTGETTQAAAKLFDVSPGRISQIRNQLEESWHKFQSDELAEVTA